MTTNENTAQVIQGSFPRTSISFHLVPQDGGREVGYKLQPDPEYPTGQLLAEKIAEASGEVDAYDQANTGPELRDKDEVGRIYNLTQKAWLREDQTVDRQIQDGDRLQYVRRSVAGLG